MSTPEPPNPDAVLRLRDLAPPYALLLKLLEHYRLELRLVDPGQAIPGSHWGDEEAGLIGDVVYARADTPLHSILHEACHAICMDAGRRAKLNTDAGGDDAEECGVCYLQILLSEQLPEMGCARMFADMDAWGYSFRLGSARAWFERDAEDAQEWLRQRGLLARLTAAKRP